MTASGELDAGSVVEAMAVGFLRTDSHGAILYANAWLAALLGYTRDELVAMPSLELYKDPDERHRAVARYEATDEILMGLQLRWKRKDGSPVDVQLYTTRRDQSGTTIFDIVVTEVSEVVRQRQELERTAATLDLVVLQLPAIYWVTDADLRIRRTGGAIEKVLGYRPDLFIGRTIPHVHAIEPGTTDPTEYHRRALSGEIVRYSTEYRHKLLENTLGPNRIDGRILGVIGTAIDVTAARTLERRMVDAQRAESLGVLAGGLAHDFNNLLVAILGNADLALRDMPPGAIGRSELDNIRHAGRRAAELIDQLLAYAGRGAGEASDVAPQPVIDELLRIINPTMPRGVDIRVDVPRELVVRAAPSQLRQALLNLLANARDALAARGRGGRIAISARAVAHDGAAHVDDVLTASGDNYVAIEVSDDGPGVSLDARRRIFEPFYTTKASGHGLGLAAVLGIVRSHGGGLRVAAEPGDGARFTILWPSAGSPLPATGGAPARETRTVLVIDDEALVRDVVARMVGDLGYFAVAVADGATALDIVETRPVDAVIVDLSMPGMNGAEVIAALRARRPQLPVVLCSGYDRTRRGPVAADAYLPKPFDLEALAATLAKLLR
jgi:PAS domain S-box-containing protein|nr:PAS domain S-box protein [Kofleriaceae bacterium]